MTLIKCKECGEKISSSSKFCVHCGYKDREIKKLVFFLILSYLLSIIGLFVAGLISGIISIFLSIKVMRDSKKQITKFFSVTSMTIAIGVMVLSFINIIKNLESANRLNAFSIIGSLAVPYIIAIIYWAILRVIEAYGIKEKLRSLIVPIIFATLPLILLFAISNSVVLNWTNIFSSMIIVAIFSIPSIIKSIKKNK